MNPKTVLGQSIAASVFLCALAVYNRPELTFAATGLGLAWALLLNHIYSRRLHAAMRGRTDKRRRGDSAIARQLVISYIGPLILAVVLILTDADLSTHIGAVRAREVQALLAAPAFMLVSWVASSHVDWYYIRPRIDGVVCAPPCKTSRQSHWKGVTRKWYIHRTVAALATMGAVVVLAVVVFRLLDREMPQTVANFGGLTAIVTVGFLFLSDEVASIKPTARALRSPTYWLGDDLRYRLDDWYRGYVLHVAVPLTKFKPLKYKSGDIKKPHQQPPLLEEVPTKDLYRARIPAPTPFRKCGKAQDGKCKLVNPECLWHEPVQPAEPARLLVL